MSALVAPLVHTSTTRKKWSTLGRGRASDSLPKALRFKRSGRVPEVIWVGPQDRKLAKRVIAQLRDSKWMALDTEFDLVTQDLIMFSLSDGDIRVAVHAEALGYFRGFLEEPEPRKVWHNALADLPVMAKAGVRVAVDADTMVTDFYVDENRNKGKDDGGGGGGRGHGLKACALDWLGLQMTEFSDLFGKRKKGEPFPELAQLMYDNLEASSDYASLDAYATYQLFALQRKILKASISSSGRSLWWIYQRYEVPALRALSRMEQRGFPIDQPVLDEIGVELEKTVVRSRWVMQYLLPAKVKVSRVKNGQPWVETLERDKIKLTSPTVLATIFYDLLKRPVINPDKPRTTEEASLQAWAEDGCLLSDIILSLRRAQKMRHDFVGYRAGDMRGFKNPQKPNEGRYKGLLSHLRRDSVSGVEVIHTHVNPIGTVTGRISNSEPNLQQVPSRAEKDPYRIRRAFVARPGSILVVADYDQAELRVMAHLSADPVMLESFKTGIDLHAQTAKAAFNLRCDVKEVKALFPDKRSMAKIVNFGIAYGMSAAALARKLGVSVPQAEKFISAFFRLYRGVYRWLEGTKKLAHRQGYVETLLGRRRRLTNLRAQDMGLVRAAERQAINAPIQGGVGDIMRVAMARIDQDPDLLGREARILLQVHDELIVECPEIDATQVRGRVQGLMEGAMALRVPLKADAHLGPHWEAAKGDSWEKEHGYGP